MLDTAAVARITGLLEALQAATRGQIAVVTVPALGEFTAKQVAEHIGNLWRVGPVTAPDDPMFESGAVFLLAPADRGIHLALANGAARFMPQPTVDSVLALMRPDFVARRYGDGLERGVRALVALFTAQVRAAGVPDTLSPQSALNKRRLSHALDVRGGSQGGYESGATSRVTKSLFIAIPLEAVAEHLLSAVSINDQGRRGDQGPAHDHAVRRLVASGVGGRAAAESGLASAAVAAPRRPGNTR